MSRVFADTAFWVAYLNERDQYHRLAVELLPQYAKGIVLSDHILTELANFYAGRQQRTVAGELCRGLLKRQTFKVVHVDQALLEEGLQLYLDRPDKRWSLTDCVSFIIMKREGLTEALTSDRYFEQAGFRILLQ